jgi:hypothetical protein
MLSTTIPTSDRNSLCQFWNDSNQNREVITKAATDSDSPPWIAA